jgi:two-component system, OmpR family, sensor histidine kinase MtrB
MKAIRTSPRCRSARVVFAASIVGLVVVALINGVALAVLTTQLHRLTSRLAASVESLRLAEEAEIALLHHSRADAPDSRRVFAQTLRRAIEACHHSVTSREEEVSLRTAEQWIAAYLDATERAPVGGNVSPQFEAASRGLQALIRVNVEDANAARAAAGTWDRIANLLAVGTGIPLLALAIGLGVWLRGKVLRPLLELAEQMDCFAKGDRSVRAGDGGAAELYEMANRFNEMAEALEHQREAQIGFLGGVAHDLRNPLAALRLSSGTLLRGQVGTVDPSARRTLELVARQVGRLDRMIGDLLDRAAIESGTLELRRGEVDGRALVIDVIDLYQSTLERHHLEADLPPEPLLFTCDPLRIEQVLGNLISNAIKYSPNGGEVRIGLRVERGRALFSVTDPGIGIAPAELPHVFEPFRRARSARQEIPGAGLGLSVVRRLVEAHGGEIRVTSVVGVGSTFCVSLPLGAAQGSSNETRAGRATRTSHSAA